MVSPVEKYRNLIDSWREEPLRFIRFFWPTMKLYPKQAAIFDGLKQGGETFVHAAHQVGKSRAAGLAALWFLCSRSPAKVITSSSSNKQLRRVLWGEIGALIRTAQYSLGFERNELELYRTDQYGAKVDNHFCIGLVTNTIENFQGHHLDLGDGIPRTMAIFDEASGVNDIYYEAAQSWAKCMLILGNPLNTRNFFYKGCRKGNGKRRRVVHISAEDSPNVQFGKRWAASGRPGVPPQVFPGVISHDQYEQRLIDWDQIKQHIRLKGLFFEDENQLLFPPTWLDEAYEYRDSALRDDIGPFALGIDTAGRGRDETVWIVIGPLGIRYLYATREPDSMKIVGRTLDIMRNFSIPGSRVAFDSGGGGKECADRLREQGYMVRDLAFGASARDSKQYANMRAELYGRMRQRLDIKRWHVATMEQEDEGVRGVTFGIPDDPKLREELAMLPLMLDSEGRLKLPPKDRPTDREQANTNIIVIRDILKRSPDRADALVLAHEAYDPPHSPYAPTLERPLLLA